MPASSASLGHREQPPRLLVDRADRERERRVAVVAVADRAEVELQEVALDHPARARDAVHDLVVDRRAQHRGERRLAARRVVQERRGQLARLDLLARDPVELGRGDAGLHERRHPDEDLAHVAARLAHLVELALGLDLDHATAPIAFVMRAVMSSMEPMPSILDDRLRVVREHRLGVAAVHVEALRRPPPRCRRPGPRRARGCGGAARRRRRPARSRARARGPARAGARRARRPDPWCAGSRRARSPACSRVARAAGARSRSRPRRGRARPSP